MYLASLSLDLPAHNTERAQPRDPTCTARPGRASPFRLLRVEADAQLPANRRPRRRHGLLRRLHHASRPAHADKEPVPSVRVGAAECARVRLRVAGGGRHQSVQIGACAHARCQNLRRRKREGRNAHGPVSRRAQPTGLPRRRWRRSPSQQQRTRARVLVPATPTRPCRTGTAACQDRFGSIAQPPSAPRQRASRQIPARKA